MTNSNHSNCPKCHSPIPDDAPGGLCPKCALESAAKIVTSTTGGGKTPPPAIADIAPHFPDLEILELLGAGGMGAVYKARQPQLDRFVALKVLSHDLAGDPAFVERFNREARVLARLNHPNIVGIHDFGTAGPYGYLLMEFVDGVNLRQAMRAGRFTPTEALAMVQHLCAALMFAHEEGILHRDIKPENILIDSKGRVKIADFGIAKLVGEPPHPDITLTLQGSALGSPHYMAPEQIETPGDVDQRADIYSLGVVLYEMLTGELPIGRFALPSEKAAMDARIDHIVLRTLEKERGARFQSAEEVMTEVGAVVQNPAGPRKGFAPVVGSEARETARFSLASAILTGLSLVGMIAGFYLGNEYRDVGLSREAGRILWFVMVILSAMTAITGFLLGTRALGEIRRSGGEKVGLGLAVFATVVWPILLMGMLSGALLGVMLAAPVLPLAAAGSGGGLTQLVVMFCTLIPLVISAFILVRGLVRWAGGVATKDGGRRHPGLGRPVLVAILLSLLLPLLLASVFSLILPSSDRRDPFAEAQRLMAEEEARFARIIAAQEGDEEVDEEVPWRLGKPEVTLLIAPQPGQRMSLRLILRDEHGKTTWTTDLEELELPPGSSGEQTWQERAELQVGTFIKSDDGKGSIQALAAVWPRTARISRSEEDLSGWTFSSDLPNELSFEKPMITTLRIATSGTTGPEGAEGVLALEVTVTALDE